MTYKNDYILRLSCGRWNTAILTKFGQVWICGNFQPSKLVKKMSISESDEPEPETNKKGKPKKGRKQNQKREQPEEENNNYTDIPEQWKSKT